MDEHEFQRLLVLFPVVRSRDYCEADSESSGQASSHAAGHEVKDWQDAWGEQETKTEDTFWDELRSAARNKVGAPEAEKFFDAFRKIYQKLVCEELSKEAMQSFVNS